MGTLLSGGSGKIGVAVQRVQEAAQQLSRLKGYTGASGASAALDVTNRALGQLSVTVKTLGNVPQVKGDAAGKVSRGVTAVATAAQALSNLSKYTGAKNAGGVLDSVNNALNQLKNVLNNMNSVFNTSGKSMGSNFVNGLRGGLAPASSVLQAALNNAITSNLGVSHDGGNRLATELKNGFNEGLNGLTDSLKNTINGMLTYLDSQKPSFRSKGVALANELKSGFESVQINTNTSGPAGGGDESYHYGRQITNRTQSNRTIIYNVHENAVPVDARNMTVREAQGMMTLALEGLNKKTSGV